MARETQRAALVLSDIQRQMLTELSGSRTSPAREVERAKIFPKESEILAEAKAWVIHLACTNPRDFGLAAVGRTTVRLRYAHKRRTEASQP